MIYRWVGKGDWRSLKTDGGRKEVLMEVNVEEIKINVKLKIAPSNDKKKQ